MVCHLINQKTAVKARYTQDINNSLRIGTYINLKNSLIQILMPVSTSTKNNLIPEYTQLVPRFLLFPADPSYLVIKTNYRIYDKNISSFQVLILFVYRQKAFLAVTVVYTDACFA